MTRQSVHIIIRCDLVWTSHPVDIFANTKTVCPELEAGSQMDMAGKSLPVLKLLTHQCLKGDG